MALRKHMPDCHEQSCTFQTVARTKYRKAWFVHHIYNFLPFPFPTTLSQCGEVVHVETFACYNSTKSIKGVIRPYIIHTPQIFQRIPIAKTKNQSINQSTNINLISKNEIQTMCHRGIWVGSSLQTVSKRGTNKRIIQWVQAYVFYNLQVWLGPALLLTVSPWAVHLKKSVLPISSSQERWPGLRPFQIWSTMICDVKWFLHVPSCHIMILVLWYIVWRQY